MVMKINSLGEIRSTQEGFIHTGFMFSNYILLINRRILIVQAFIYSLKNVDFHAEKACL